MPPTNAAVVMAKGLGTTVTENVWAAVANAASATWMEKLNVPGAVGVPLKRPVLDSVSPAGKDPESSTNP